MCGRFFFYLNHELIMKRISQESVQIILIWYMKDAQFMAMVY